MSLLKYADEAKGRKVTDTLHFGRSSLDGMPFRGAPLMLRDEEFEELTEVVNDSFVRVFEVAVNQEDAAALASVVEKAASGWFQIHKMAEKMVPQADGSIRVYVYCVWTKPQKQLNQERASLFGTFPT